MWVPVSATYSLPYGAYSLKYLLLYFNDIYFCLEYIGSKSTPIDNSILNFQSTCHEALETCNKHSQCQEMVASITRNCNHRQCKKANCMESLQNFYRNESMHSYAIEIAFCLCKWVPTGYCYYLNLGDLICKIKIGTFVCIAFPSSNLPSHTANPDSFLGKM